MPDECPVHISRQSLHGLEVPTAFETDGPFDVVLANHGESLHVHLHLDDELSRAASLAATNHFVEGGTQRAIRVDVDPNRIPEDGIFGRLKVASAYGSETRWIDVELEPPVDESGGVEVDEALSQPQPREQSGDGGSALDRPELPVLALGAVAIGVAVLAAVLVGDQLVLFGALAVVAGVAVALYVLVSS